MARKMVIFWFRQDLRITDNPGLFAASRLGAVMPIFILEDNLSSHNQIGSASKWWLYHSLCDLNKSLKEKLNFYRGKPEKIILKLVRKYNIEAVYWNRCYEPKYVECDAFIKSSLKKMQVECNDFNASLLWEPWEILKKNKTPYKVYSAFYHHGCLQAGMPRLPIAKPRELYLIKDKQNKNDINSLNLLAKTNWCKKLDSLWEVGEKAAYKKLICFLNKGLKNYKENRNYPGKSNVSTLSMHLHFGEISPNQIWHRVKMLSTIQSGIIEDSEFFLSELAWREFSYYLLYHFPQLPTENFQRKFDHFPWENNKKFLTAWQKGKTGYPLVDAGMRELWKTGYMHNRARMVVASFLVKNLRIHWHQGAAWFWDCLLDADLANNSANWQWVAGCGVDAAPYFRIFNPVTQGEKFDAEGTYTRRYIPELAKLPNKYLFKPWMAPASVLETAGIILGKSYPIPIVDLSISREEVLAIYHRLIKTVNKPGF